MKTYYHAFIVLLLISSCSGFGYVELRVENTSSFDITEIKIDNTSFGDLQPEGISLYKDIERPLSGSPEVSFVIDGNTFFFPKDSEVEEMLPIGKFKLQILYNGNDASYVIIEE